MYPIELHTGLRPCMIYKSFTLRKKGNGTDSRDFNRRRNRSRDSRRTRLLGVKGAPTEVKGFVFKSKLSQLTDR